MDMTNTKNRESGFTLIELMITLVLIAVIVGLAGPPFRDMLLNNRVSSVANTFMSSLLFARSEALKRNAAVRICKTADGSACTTSGGWDQGWLIYADSDEDGNVDDNEVLQQEGSIASDLTINAATNNNWIEYRSNGSAVGNNGVLTADTRFVVCSPDGDIDKARVVTVSTTGRPRQSKGAGADDC